MPRPLRINYPGASCRRTSRGDRREPLLLDSLDRHTFRRGLGEACVRTGWLLHGWCQLEFHFHVSARTAPPRSKVSNSRIDAFNGAASLLCRGRNCRRFFERS
jgi:hypothetical protein